MSDNSCSTSRGAISPHSPSYPLHNMDIILFSKFFVKPAPLMLFAILLMCSLLIHKLANLVTIHHALVAERFLYYLSSCQDCTICLSLKTAGAMEHSLRLPTAIPVPGPETAERNKMKLQCKFSF